MDTSLSSPPLSEDAAVLAFVTSRDIPCPSCSYNLRALTEPRCPECGEPLRLKVTPLDPRLGLWLAATVPLALTAGIGCFFLLLLAKQGFPRGQNSMNVHLVVWPSIACIPLTVAAILYRRVFTHLSNPVRLLLAILAPVPGLFIIANFLFYR